jgi:hypothetical protein
MKVAFCDIDGVFRLRDPSKDGHKFFDLSRDRVNRYDDWAKKHDISTVISSSHRFSKGPDKCATYLNFRHTPIIGITPVLNRTKGWLTRHHEIAWWVYRHWHELESFVIIDDLPTMGWLTPFLANCVSEVGFDIRVARVATRILDRTPPWHSQRPFHYSLGYK